MLQVRRKDQFERKHGGGYDEAEFNEHPERYISTFAHKIAPYSSVIVNGIYWSPKTPRLLTIPDAKSLITPINSPWMATTKGIEIVNILQSWHVIFCPWNLNCIQTLKLRLSKFAASFDWNLWHFCWPWWLNRIHERMYNYWWTILLIWCRHEPRQENIQGLIIFQNSSTVFKKIYTKTPNDYLLNHNWTLFLRGLEFWFAQSIICQPNCHWKPQTFSEIFYSLMFIKSCCQMPPR